MLQRRCRDSADRRRLQQRVVEDGIALRSCLEEFRELDGGRHLGRLAKLTVVEVKGKEMMLTGKFSLSHRYANRFLPDAHLLVFANFENIANWFWPQMVRHAGCPFSRKPITP